MPSIVNTNLFALDTQNNLAGTQSMLAKSIQRLSSGLKINNAGDDPAGLAIATRMKVQLDGLGKAQQNASEGTSMLQTAEGGLANTTQLLEKMRSLAVQAANGTNSQTDRSSIQAEITQLQAQIQQVAMTTQYNGTNLLDGSLANVQFQVGANAGQTISFGISSAQQGALGNNVVSLTGGQGNGAGYAITEAATAGAAGAVVNNVTAQTLSVQGNGNTRTIAVTDGQSAQSIAAAFNNLTADTGITATASTTATLAFGTAGTQSFTINGQQISASWSSDYSAAINAINQQTGNTGVTATLGSSGIVLSNTTGADIAVVNTGANDITLTGTYNSGTQAAPTTSAGTTVTLTGNATPATSASVVGGFLSFNSSGGFSITTSVGSGTTGGLFQVQTANGSTLNTVGSVNVTTLDASGIPIGANKALNIIDAALAQVNSARADLGALQNRFAETVKNLQTSSLNLASSLSTIQDADFAQETTNLSTGQIKQQAAMAMLAQANQMPGQVLSLLR